MGLSAASTPDLPQESSQVLKDNCSSLHRNLGAVVIQSIN